MDDRLYSIRTYFVCFRLDGPVCRQEAFHCFGLCCCTYVAGWLVTLLITQWMNYEHLSVYYIYSYWDGHWSSKQVKIRMTVMWCDFSWVLFWSMQVVGRLSPRSVSTNKSRGELIFAVTLWRVPQPAHRCDQFTKSNVRQRWSGEYK